MTMYTDLHERKGKYITRLEARINHIMLIATFHGAPCKFSFETVLSILSVSESGVMNVTMYIPINNHHSILTQVKQLNILFLYIVLSVFSLVKNIKLILGISTTCQTVFYATSGYFLQMYAKTIVDLVL